jgi:Loader and inhibitor of phage G40P
LKTKRETYALLEEIHLYYEQFQINQKIFDGWHEVLKDFSYERLHQNLLKYVTHASFPPKICDLISSYDKISRAIPDAMETDKNLMNAKLPANEEVIKTELANIRKLLGIQRED